MSQPNAGFTNTGTMIFTVLLCLGCALALSLTSGALSERQESAKELDRAKQMLIAAQLYHSDGYFLLRDSEGHLQPAKRDKAGKLTPGKTTDIAPRDEIFAVFNARIHPFFVNAQGERKSLQESGINLSQYLADNRKIGYDRQPWKLVYEIAPDSSEGSQEEAQAPKGQEPTAKGIPEGYILHISGFGLWDFIFGYLAISNDGNEVIGISWYEHKETPGLGAGIAEKWWQDQFPGKHIFESSTGGSPLDSKRAPLGINVVRGKVKDVYASGGPKVGSAVDGMAGATLTGNGVTKAYKETLENYRPFLSKLYEENTKGKTSTQNSHPKGKGA